MAGWISEPIANPAGESQGFENVASQPFEGQDWLAPETELDALRRRNLALYGQTDPETGVQLAQPQPRAPAADLQKRYGVPAAFGVSGLSFTSDLPESVAADMHDAKLAEQRRADAAARAPDGIVAGVERFGASMATQLLDPIGALSMMVPIGGEVRGVGLLERAGSALTRGAATGAVVTSPFVALHKLYADAYGEDYSAGDALREILMGGALGGGLHAGATVAGDLIGRAFRGSAAQAIVDDDPDIRHAAASEAVSAALDDRPPQSQAIIELAAATKAQAELQRFAAYQTRLDEESGAALGLGDQADRAGAAALRLADLRDQHQAMIADIGDAQARLEAASDPATAERLGAIEAELTGPPIAAARRADLMTERAMLIEGAKSTPADDALAAARAQAELAALQAGADRLGSQVDQAQQLAARTASQAAAGDRAFRIRAASVEGREALAQSLAERTLQRFAGTLRVTLSPEDARTLARSVLREGADPAQTVAEIRTRERAGPVRPWSGIDAGGAAERLGADARGAAGDIADAARRPLDDAAAIKAAADAAARAGEPVEVDDTELAELHDFMQRADEAGALDAEHKAELAAIANDRETTQSWIKALPQAAACLLRSVL